MLNCRDWLDCNEDKNQVLVHSTTGPHIHMSPILILLRGIHGRAWGGGLVSAKQSMQLFGKVAGVQLSTWLSIGLPGRLACLPQLLGFHAALLLVPSYPFSCNLLRRLYGWSVAMPVQRLLPTGPEDPVSPVYSRPEHTAGLVSCGVAHNSVEVLGVLAQTDHQEKTLQKFTGALRWGSFQSPCPLSNGVHSCDLSNRCQALWDSSWRTVRVDTHTAVSTLVVFDLSRSIMALRFLGSWGHSIAVTGCLRQWQTSFGVDTCTARLS